MDDVLQESIEDLVVINSGAVWPSKGRHQHDQYCKFSNMIQMYMWYPVLIFLNNNVYYII